MLDLEPIRQRLRERELAVSALERRIPPRTTWSADSGRDSNWAEVVGLENQAEAIRADSAMMHSLLVEAENLRLANRLLREAGRSAMAHFVEMPKILRLSNALKGLREAGLEMSARKVETLANEVGRHCPAHGYLADPIVGTVGEDKVAFACPDCSGAAIKAAWLAEPPAT